MSESPQVLSASQQVKLKGRVTHIPTMREFAFTPLIRIFHWLRFLAIMILLISGFYIAWPFLMDPKSTDVLIQGWMRFSHLIFGFIFSCITISRNYLFLFSKDKSERRSLLDALSIDRWRSQIKAYVFLGKPDEKSGLYGPLQLVTYASFYSCSLIMVLTGLALYSRVYHEGLGQLLYAPASWLTYICGGLANVRNIHHWFTWVFIVFLIVHVYMVIWTGIRFKKAAVDAIISGYDYHTHAHIEPFPVTTSESVNINEPTIPNKSIL